LTRKTARQSHCWTSNAPTVGPAAAERAEIEPKIATATGTRAGGKTVSTIASADGTSAAAPRAWTTRKATSSPAVGARAHRAEASVKATSPTTNVRRRPKRSAIRPAGTRAAARAIVYAESVHDMVVNDTVGKLDRMSSKATNSTWASRNTMKEARLATASVARGSTVRGCEGMPTTIKRIVEIIK
jgi:hypothetical protein